MSAVLDFLISLKNNPSPSVDGRFSLEELLARYKQNAFPLTSDQLAWMREMHRNGFRYLAQDADESVFAFMHRPIKNDNYWADQQYGDYIDITGLGFIADLVSWEDQEPLAITDILKVYAEIL